MARRLNNNRGKTMHRDNTEMFTYKATNTLNGKFYLGSTTDFEKRKKSHLSSQKNYPFQNALRKKPEMFEWEVWEDNSDDPILEQTLLDMWFGKEQCYNLCPYSNRPRFNMKSVREWGTVNGPIQGRRRLEEKNGIFSPAAPKSEWGKKGGSVSGPRSLENGTGIFREGSVTFESRSAGGKTGGLKGGLSTSKQRWKCLETGHITTPGALTNYQRKRGIPTDRRERIA
jgi:hypothetical protein